MRRSMHSFQMRQAVPGTVQSLRGEVYVGMRSSWRVPAAVCSAVRAFALLPTLRRDSHLRTSVPLGLWGDLPVREVLSNMWP